MTAPGPERPAAIGVIGWGSALLGALMLLGGLTGMASGVLARFTPAQPLELPPGMDQIMVFFRYVVPLSLLQVVIGGVVLGASIQFLRLRESGRLTLEAANWFGVAYTIALSAWFLSFWSRAAAGFAQVAQQPVNIGSLVAVGIVLTVVFTAVQVAIIGAVIWVLRSKPVRNAMHS